MPKEGFSENACPVDVMDGCFCPEAPACKSHLAKLKKGCKSRDAKVAIDGGHREKCDTWCKEHEGLTAGFPEAVSGKNIRGLDTTKCRA